MSSTLFPKCLRTKQAQVKYGGNHFELQSLKAPLGPMCHKTRKSSYHNILKVTHGDKTWTSLTLTFRWDTVVLICRHIALEKSKLGGYRRNNMWEERDLNMSDITLNLLGYLNKLICMRKKQIQNVLRVKCEAVTIREERKQASWRTPTSCLCENLKVWIPKCPSCCRKCVLCWPTMSEASLSVWVCLKM